MSVLPRSRRPISPLPTVVAALLLASGPGLLEGSPRPAPSADQDVRRAGSDTVRAAVVRRWPPYYRWPEGGEPTGFGVESFREITESSGLVPEFRRFGDFPAAIEAFRRGEVDVIPNLGDVPSRREWARFTSPVQTFPVVLFSREAGPELGELSDLAGRTVGVVRENIGITLLADRPSVTPEVYSGVEEALFGLLAGEVDAVIYPRPVLMALARDIGAEAEVRAPGPALAEVRRAVAVRPGRAALHARLDSAVSTYVGSAAYDRHYRRWFGHPEPFWTVRRVAWTAGGVILLTVVVLAGWRYRTVQRLNRKLRDSERRFRQLAENIEEVFWLRDPASEEMLYVSPAYEDVWGRPVAELHEDPDAWVWAIHPDERERMRDLAIRDAATSFDEEYRIVRPDGEVRWIRDRAFPVRDEDGEVYRVAGVAQDVTGSKRMEDQLRWRALHDMLTGLANRSLLQDRLEQGLARSRRHEEPLGVLMLDVDEFKRVNDSLGHTAGDLVLTELAHRLEAAVREEDTVSRWGGDEFVVVLPDLADPEAVAEAWDRIRSAVRPPIEIEDEVIHVDLTAGAVVHAHGDHPRTVQARNPEELVRFGSLSLHWAKEDKPGGFSFFDRTRMGEEGPVPIQREGELRDALERGEILPHYQPIVRLDDRSRMSLEALARWEHPREGVLGPAEFIPLAEKLGLIASLQEAIIRRGCRDLASREETAEPGAPTRMRFNISGQQFRDTALAETLEQTVREAGARPEQVILEVTETSLMQVPATVHALRKTGFEVSIDDFGTGYSTLTYLRELDVDELKVDMTFVQEIADSPSDAALVETMLTLGERLGLRVVAEGIETEGQLRKLRSIGYTYGQGYLFGRPGPSGGADSGEEDPEDRQG